MPTSGVPVSELLSHSGWLRGLARSLARDAATADDLVQQTWLRAMETPPRDPRAAAGWLSAVVRNLARDAARRSSRRGARESAAARPDVTPATLDLVARAEAQRRLLDAVVALDEPFRTVVLLRFFEGLTPRAIARRTGVPAVTVRTRLHRALVTLRRRLGNDAHGLAVVFVAAGGGTGGGVVSKLLGGALVTSKQKVAVALLALACLGGGAYVLVDGDPPPPAAETADAPAAAPAEAPRARAAAAEEPSAPVEEDPAVSQPAVEESPVVVTMEPERERLSVTILRYLPPREPPPGVKEIAEGEDPVIPDEGTAVGTGAGGIRPVGWSRWHPIPPKGGVTWRGRVTDADGKPVEGADVYRVRTDASGTRASPSSFQWVTDVAKTAADGTFEAKGQPDGAYLVAANWHAKLNGPRGLDLAASRPAEGKGDAVVSGLDLRLPFSVARLGGVRGVVRGEDGKPIASARVVSGYEAPWTGADGRFEILGLEPGDRTVTFGATGHADERRTVAVRAGAVEEMDVRLTYAKRGSLEIAGSVADEDGLPVAVPLFLTDGSRDGARWARSGADGRFRFERLPDAWADRTVDVMVSPNPGRDLVLGASKQGVPVPENDLRFTVRRLTTVTVHVRDVDGTPIALFNLDVRSDEPGGKPRQLHSMSAYEEDGTTTIHAPAGRLLISVEGKGHRSMEVAVDVPDARTPKEIVIEMTKE